MLIWTTSVCSGVLRKHFSVNPLTTPGGPTPMARSEVVCARRCSRTLACSQTRCVFEWYSCAKYACASTEICMPARVRGVLPLFIGMLRLYPSACVASIQSKHSCRAAAVVFGGWTSSFRLPHRVLPAFYDTVVKISRLPAGTICSSIRSQLASG